VTDVFISYAREDQGFVRRLHEALASRGREAWVDWQDIPPTAKWRAEIDSAIEGADAFVFVISPDSLRSPVCREEIDHAVEYHKRFVPILHREVDDAETPPAVSEHNWIVLRDQADLDEGLDTLLRALDTDLESVRTHTRLLVRAGEWEAAGGDSSLLLRGRDLEAAERWLGGADGGPQPTAIHTRYVLESRKAATRGQRTRFIALAVGFALMLGFAIFAFLQRSQAVRQREEAERQTRIAQSRELAASALSQLEVDAELALLLAREAVDRAPTEQAVGVLRETLARSNLVSVLPHGEVVGEEAFVGEHAVQAAVVVPGGDTVVSKSVDGTVLRWTEGRERPEVLFAPEEGFLSGVAGPFRDVAISPDGQRIAVSTGRRVQLFPASGGGGIVLERAGGYPSVAFSPDGSVVAAGAGTRVRLWDAETGAHLRDLRTGSGGGGMVAFSPDGRFVTAAEGWFIAGDGDVLSSGAAGAAAASVFEVDTGRLVHRLSGHAGAVASALFSPDGRRIVTAAGGEAVVWDAGTGTVLSAFAPGGGPLLSARFDPTGERVVTASLDGTARIFDAATGKEEVVLRGHDGQVYDARFSPDGLLVLTASTDGSARLWDGASGSTVFTLRSGQGAVLTASFDDGADRVVTGGQDGTVRQWDIGDPATVTVLKGHTAPVTGVGFAPGGRALFTEGEDDTVRVWNPIAGRELFPSIFHLFPTNSAFSEDGRLLLTIGSGMDSTFDVWRIPSGERVAQVFTFTGDRGGHSMAAMNGDGSLVVTADFAADAHTATVWDVATGEEVVVLDHPVEVRWATFTYDGRVATGDADGAVRLWGPDSGQELGTLCCHEGPVVEVAAAEDGRLLSWALRNVRIWDPASDRPVASLPHDADVADAAFSPQGDLVATASGRVARVFRAEDGEPVHRLEGHVGALTDVAWSSDGALLATAAEDGTARVWAASSGRLIATLGGHADAVTAAAFSDDGRMLATSSSDGTGRVYPSESFLPVPDLMALAEGRVVRELTAEERRQFLPGA
jgi:WD40 repeat protein